MGGGTRPKRAGSVWERPEPPRPAPLSRDRIVGAALEIADADGLEAVSLRKVGAALGAGPMRLYGYVESKEELLDLMVDTVYGEMVAAGAIGGPWKEALRTLAARLRAAAGAHPWFLGLLGGRPHQGPHALELLEQALAALRASPGFGEIDAVLQAVRTVHAYVVGALWSEALELRAGQSESEWQAAQWPYLQRVLATGRFPTLAEVVERATHPSSEEAFGRGLEMVIAGIEGGLARAR
ncbi:MAG: TetR/AcrR family transcriptional regulator C-terminal domain-containing protein [Nannocystaceae bacterium]